MKDKINIAELLKDCPKGMALYSPIFGDVYLDKVRPHLAIVVTTDKEQGDFKKEFLYDGRYGMNGECMLFPSKDKTTWEGFQRPFKDGDILHVDCTDEFDDKRHEYIFIFNEIYNCNVYSYCYYYVHNHFYSKASCLSDNKYPIRFAAEEEKQKLFEAIKENGYKWNAETKTLKRLPKFKVGDNYELVPNKFDITTLKSFESKVLVRDYDNRIWIPTFWGKYLEDDSNCRYLTTNGCYKYCIPYAGNEHLLGEADDCDEFYKTWK